MINWQYFFSKELQLRVAFSDEVDYIYTEDKIKYSKSEIEILKKHGGITKEIHAIKKEFNGEVKEIDMEKFKKNAVEVRGPE